MSNIADVILDELTSHDVDLVRIESGMRKKVLYQLETLERALVAEIQDIDPTAPARLNNRLDRLNALLAQTTETIRKYYRRIKVINGNDLQQLAVVEHQAVVAAVNTAVTVEVMTAAIPPAVLEELARNTLIEGAPSRVWWSRQAGNLRRSFSDQMRQGVLRGESVADLTRRVRGRATGKRNTYWDARGNPKVFVEFEGGIMDTSTRQAETLVRTSVISVTGAVTDATYEANKDVIKGRQAQATLDTRTSDICIARSGKVWDMDGNPLPPPPNNEQYPGPPAWHWGCRTRIIPVLKTWEDLATKQGYKGKMREVPESTQESMDGQVAAGLTYEGWLKKQSKERQVKVLGPTRYRMWKDGEISSLSQLIDQSGNPLTVAELQAQYSD